jgi:cytochrome c oxidase accessory protein FixG
MSEQVTYFAAQKVVYPRAVKGRYRTIKWSLITLFMSLYYLTPWLRWERAPGVPDQAVLIDMAGRRAYFFGIEIWPQEVYYLTGILILAAVSLFFVTSLLGRVWCGYACFQTVWVDMFVAVERFFQGDRNAHIKLDQGKWTFDKLWRKAATHLSWILIGMLTGGAFVFYFNDAPTLARDILALNVSSSVLPWVAGLTLSTYVMAGFAREQVCAYMCPYARFQSGMFDRDTLIISYDPARGEPRAPHKKGESWDGRGDCVDCGLCVAVCPVGIDIRNGLQMQCIACGLCVDACNSVMDKVERPRGLVRYDTENNYNARAAAKACGTSCGPDKLRLVRPRTIYYALILAVVGSVMLYGLLTRPVYELHALRERSPAFVKLSSGAVRNDYTLKIFNKTYSERSFALSVEGLPQAEVKINGAGSPTADDVRAPADDVGTVRLSIAIPPKQLSQVPDRFFFIVKEKETGATARVESMFITGER